MQDKKRSLPHFNSHTGHRKLEHLREGSPPEPYVQDFLHQVTGERRRNEVRILDMGCGRGDLVAWLCEQGWDAWGADPEETYLSSGKPLLGDRIRRIENGLPFVDSSFDVILSSQVLEHVEDFSGFVGELARVSKLGAEGLHIFPAPRQPVEGHMLVPFVHWLPKGRCRQYALYPILASGLGASYFTEYTLSERVRIFSHFSDTDTYYRSWRMVEAEFEAKGFSCNSTMSTERKLRCRYPLLPRIAIRALTPLYLTFRGIYLRTRHV